MILFCSIINIDRIAGLSGLVKDKGGRVFVSWAEKRVIDEAVKDDAPPAAFYQNLSIPETYDSSLFADIGKGDLIFTSSFEDFRILSGMIPSADLVFTEWPGNLAHMNSAFREDPRFHVMHVSGHAHPAELREFAEFLSPCAVLPVHTSSPEKCAELLEGFRVLPLQDGEDFTL